MSLAAALSIPFALISGQPFPDRSLILFLTFGVIVVTLVLQGPTLPWLVRWLGLHEVGAAEMQQRDQLEAQVRIEAARESLDRLGQITQTAGLAPEHAVRIRELQRDRVGRLEEADRSRHLQPAIGGTAGQGRVGAHSKRARLHQSAVARWTYRR